MVDEELSMIEEYQRNDKIGRVLGIYSKLMNGSLVNKATEAAYYNTSERSIQRDIDDIRNYLENGDKPQDVWECLSSTIYFIIKYFHKKRRAVKTNVFGLFE